MNLDAITPGERYMVPGGVGGEPHGRWLDPPAEVGIVEVEAVGREPGRTIRSVRGRVVQTLAEPAARSGTACMRTLGAQVHLRGNHLLASEREYTEVWSAQQSVLRAYRAQLPQLRALGANMRSTARADVEWLVNAIVPETPEVDRIGEIILVLPTASVQRAYTCACRLSPDPTPRGIAHHPLAALRRLGWELRTGGSGPCWQLPRPYVAALRRQHETVGMRAKPGA